MALLRRIVNLLRRSKMDREIEAELKSHIEMWIEENVAAGMTSDEARHDALLRFGNHVVMKERTAAADSAIIKEMQMAVRVSFALMCLTTSS